MDGYIERLPKARARGPMDLISGPGEQPSLIWINREGPGIPKILTYWRTFSDIQRGEVSEAELVQQITAHMRDNVQRLPNYTCTETIERTTTSPDGEIQQENTVRLEVALIGDDELFAWPGTTKFRDSGLDDLVASGAFGTGAFGLYTKILFLNENRPELRRVNLSDLGSVLIRYDFTVLPSENEFKLTEGPDSATVGFEGSIYVDPDTLDLRRLVVHFTDIPPQFALKKASDEVLYERVPFGEEQFLLPGFNRLTLQNPGGKSQNRVRFEKCRRFEGQSTISFGDPVPLEDTKREVIQEVAIPPDTSMQIVMDIKGKPDAVAVGDLVTGKLNDRVHVDGKELIPKGAKVSARVVRMDRMPDVYVLGLRVTDVEWKGKHASVNGYLERPPAEEGARDRGVKLVSLEDPGFGAQYVKVVTRKDTGSGAPQLFMVLPRQGKKSIGKIHIYWRTLSDTPRGPAVSSAASPGSTVSGTEPDAIQEVAIPPDTSVHMVLDFQRTPDKMELGDLVTGKLSDAVKVDGKELIPKGAKVSARVVAMDRNPYLYGLSLRVTDIDWKSKHAKMDGYIERLPAAEAERDPLRRMGLATVQIEDSGVVQQVSVILIPPLAAKSIREILTYWKTF